MRSQAPSDPFRSWTVLVSWYLKDNGVLGVFPRITTNILKGRTLKPDKETEGAEPQAGEGRTGRLSMKVPELQTCEGKTLFSYLPRIQHKQLEWRDRRLSREAGRLDKVPSLGLQ